MEKDLERDDSSTHTHSHTQNSEPKTLAMLKMEKNFVAVIEKSYPRKPYDTFSIPFLMVRLEQEAQELREAIAERNYAKIRSEIADMSNILDYMFEGTERAKKERWIK